MRDAGKIRLVIDPGHGGDDPGAVHQGTGLREADVALRIAHVLKAIADTHPEFDAVLTRETDRSVPLRARTDLANGRDALLVSIHCNAAAEARAHGAEVWCFAREGPGGEESPGHAMARAIQEELAALGLRDRGVKPIYDRRGRKYVGRRLWVLRKTRRPAVLVECAFLSNPEEAARLGDDLGGFKERLAAAVFRGLRRALLGDPEQAPAGKEKEVIV
jgi:N-acetylmuramoyl-L-alanine amidase